MHKKVNVVLMIAVVFAMLLSACQPAAAPAPAASGDTQAPAAAASGEKVELAYWSMWNEGENQAVAIQESIDAFEAQNPNIHITPTWNGRENQTLLRNALASGTKVDFMDQDADQIAGGMVSGGQAYPLTDLLDTNALDEAVPFKDVFVSGTLHMFDIDGQTYLIPYIYNSAMFFYNQEAFDKAGVTDVKTWDDLISACGKLSDAGYVPMAVEGPEPGYNAFVFTYIVERLKGAGFLTQAANDKTGETWKDPAILQAAQMSRELWDKGCIPAKSAGYKWPEAQNMIASGETAMELVGSWLPTELLSATGPDFKWGALPFPEISGGAGKSTDLEGLLLSYMILKNSAHPKEAFEFLKFMLTKEQQQKMVAAGAVGVVRKGVEWPANLKGAQTAAENATVVFGEGDGLQGSNAEYWVKVVRDPFSSMFVGDVTPEDFVAKLVTDSVEYWANK